jgi:hypothetical protein
MIEIESLKPQCYSMLEKVKGKDHSTDFAAKIPEK